MKEKKRRVFILSFLWGLGILIIACVLPQSGAAQEEEEDIYIRLRETMVQKQIKARGIDDPRLLRAIREVPRHLFVPPQQRRFAYGDYPLPIGENQTISQPYIVALMTDLLDIRTGDKVLEVGTGSGYQAAVLAEITDEVYSIEIIPALAREASQKLKKLGYEEVQVKIGDGYQGWEKYAPYDGIIVTAAAKEIPPPLFEQLKEGGKLVLPLGDPRGFQTLTVVAKKDGKKKIRRLSGVRFVPLTRKK